MSTPPHIHTTLVVAVHVKINIQGYFDSAKALKQEAAFRALDYLDTAIGFAESEGKLPQQVITTESAQVLANDQALESRFDNPA
jgi:hypothetical protein